MCLVPQFTGATGIISWCPGALSF